MAADIKGTAVCWSIGGVTYAATGLSGSSMVQSVRHGRTSESTPIKGSDGDISTLVYHGQMRSLSISVVPSGTAKSDAAASRDSHMNTLVPGLKVVISDNSAGTSALETNWILKSATENRTVDGFTTIDLELENAATDLSTSAA